MNAIKSVEPGYAKEHLGVDKPRGVENAALQHERKSAVPPKEEASPSTVVSLNSSPAATGVYSKTGQLPPTERVNPPVPPKTAELPAKLPKEAQPVTPPTANGNASAVIGDGAKIHINVRGESPSASSGGSLVLGDNAKLQINARLAGASGSGGGTLVIGENASLHINTRVEGTSGAGGTLIIGENSNVHINARLDGASASGGGTLIVGDNSDVHINIRADDISGADTLIVGDNTKLHLNVRADSNNDASANTIVVGDDASVHLNIRETDKKVASEPKDTSFAKNDKPIETEILEATGLIEKSSPKTDDSQHPGLITDKDNGVRAHGEPSKKLGTTADAQWPSYYNPGLEMIRQILDHTTQQSDQQNAGGNPQPRFKGQINFFI
ncbi:MAG: hypothetical protein HYS18_01445 [Burkholderiales bacterium]|nr:hypothetical protein [Burkholderiales bacterium]